MAKYVVGWKYDDQLVKGGKAKMAIPDAGSKAEAIKLAKRRATDHRKRKRTYGYTARRA